MKSFKLVLLFISIVCIGWTVIPGWALDCIHGTWISSSKLSDYGFCRCDQGWAGPPEHSGFCVYGRENYIGFYAWNRACDRSCPWTFTNPNPECASLEMLNRSCDTYY